MDRDSTLVESAGVDEVSVIPWPLLRGKKVVKKAVVKTAQESAQ